VDPYLDVTLTAWNSSRLLWESFKRTDDPVLLLPRGERDQSSKRWPSSGRNSGEAALLQSWWRPALRCGPGHLPEMESSPFPTKPS